MEVMVARHIAPVFAGQVQASDVCHDGRGGKVFGDGGRNRGVAVNRHAEHARHDGLQTPFGSVVGGQGGAGKVDDRLAVGYRHHERAAWHGGDVVVHHGAPRLYHAHVEVLFPHGRPAVDDHGVGHGKRFVKGALQFGGVVVHDGEHHRFGPVLDEQVLHHEAVGVDVLPAARLDAGGHQLAAGGDEGHARLAAHGNHGGAAHGKRRKVGRADGQPRLHDGRASLEGGPCGAHVGSRLHFHVVVKHHRPVRLDGGLFDGDDGIEFVRKVVARVGAHVVDSQLPCAGVR